MRRVRDGWVDGNRRLLAWAAVLVAAAALLGSYAWFAGNGAADREPRGALPTADYGGLETTAVSNPTLRVGAFGDSLSAYDTGWVSVATRALGGTVVRNVSDPSLRTAEFLKRIPLMDAANPDVIVMLGGTNDVPTLPISDTVANLATLGGHFQRKGKRIILGTIPPRNLDVNLTAGKVVALNKQLASLAKERGWGLVDFYSVLADDGRYKPGLTTDGIHPSADGVALMAAAAERVLSVKQPA